MLAKIAKGWVLGLYEHDSFLPIIEMAAKFKSGGYADNSAQRKSRNLSKTEVSAFMQWCSRQDSNTALILC